MDFVSVYNIFTPYVFLELTKEVPNDSLDIKVQKLRQKPDVCNISSEVGNLFVKNTYPYFYGSGPSTQISRVWNLVIERT